MGEMVKSGAVGAILGGVALAVFLGGAARAQAEPLKLLETGKSSFGPTSVKHMLITISSISYALEKCLRKLLIR